MSEERYVSWEEINRGCISLVMNNMSMLRSMEVTIGLSDDMVPATIVSNLLNVFNLYKMPLISVVNQNAFGNELVNFVEVGKPLQSGQGILPPLPSLLMVSSMIGMGCKVEETVETYKKRGYDVTTMSLFSCSDCGYVPDLYWQRANESKFKLIFPWEL